MGGRVLITGGAGFIGCHLADELLAHGYKVRALDDLSPQVHGPGRRRPSALASDVELIVGDVRSGETVERALQGVDFVFHFAARVGVGQSMYEIADYTSVNNVGTAVLLEALAHSPVERLIVASSMSVYGEGLYRTAAGTLVADAERTQGRLHEDDWEPRTASGEPLTPLPTPETKRPSLASIYALSKFDQERMCLIFGRAYQLPTIALRFFNVYGPGQALSNPYTGVLAIFASRYLNGRPPIIFEDGLQQRDFVSVHDVARACLLALETPNARDQVFNVGSGKRSTVRDIAARLGTLLGCRDIEPEISEKHRAGDIRHCFADITLARKVLGYTPLVSLDEGLAELGLWLKGQIAKDHVERAAAELASRGLTV